MPQKHKKTWINTHYSTSALLVHDLNSLIKRHTLAGWVRRLISHFLLTSTHKLHYQRQRPPQGQRIEKKIQKKGTKNQSGITIIVSDTIHLNQSCSEEIKRVTGHSTKKDILTKHRCTQFHKRSIIPPKLQMNLHTVIVDNFNAKLPPIDRSSGQN